MRPHRLDPNLLSALAAVAAAARPAAEPWWIIGSAAAALHGVDLPMADVDLLLAPQDASRVLQRMAAPSGTDGGHGRFRSEVFGRWTEGPVPIDVMGGFRVFHQGRWTEVRPRTRVATDLPGGTVFLPSAAELAAIMRLFGRPKDLDRARRLDALRWD